MSTNINWIEISLRLCCALVAGALLGLNRGRHGRPAGLRTNMLVSLAACLSMLQVNLLLSMSGRGTTSFVMLDLMRLPLGILSGMGFIGAGAIVRRDNFVTGVTTASTLWYVTVLGLCFGGGQIALGATGTVLGFAILAGLKKAEQRWLEERKGILLVQGDLDAVDEQAIERRLSQDGLKILNVGVTFNLDAALKELRCDVRWSTKNSQIGPPAALSALTKQAGITRIQWNPD